MNELFDEVIDRENTGCAKFDQRKTIFGREDVLPFWGADMDFKAPASVIGQLKKRVDHGVFGCRAAFALCSRCRLLSPCEK